MASNDEAQLVHAWRSGDQDAGVELFDRYFKPIRRFFCNKVPDQAEDLIQQTFTAVLEGRERLRADASFRSYLFGIAHNLLRAHLRALGRARGIDPMQSSFAELAPSPSAVMAERAEHRLLLRGLRSLPIEHQLALELHYWEGLNAAELAKIMDVPHSTMRSRLARSRELLEAAIAELAGDPGLRQTTLDGLDAWAREVRGLL